MSDLKKGDTVRLKSGGPLMTVTYVGRSASGDPTVTCTWFDNNSDPKTTNLPIEAVTVEAF